MDKLKEKISTEKEVKRAQVESLIEGLEDAVHTLKETSDSVLETARKDLDLTLQSAKEFDKVPSKFVRKKQVQTTTEKLKALTTTAKEEVDGEKETSVWYIIWCIYACLLISTLCFII
jgi:hypothetical protein